MTRKTLVEKRTKALAKQFDPDTPTPIIDGYRLTYHAAIRMVARRIEIDWVRDALKTAGRPQPGNKRKHFGDRAMVVTCGGTIITVGYGQLNLRDEDS